MGRIDPEAFAIGLEIGDRLNRGLAEWRQIQVDRKNKEDARKVSEVLEKNRTARRSRNMPPGFDQYKTMGEVLKRNPGAEIREQPTGAVGPDGEPEAERYVDTPEGVISMNQFEVLQSRAQQAMGQTMVEDLDDAFGMLAQYPDNPYIKQYVGNIVAKQTQQLQLQTQQLAQQRLQLDSIKAQQEAAREGQKLADEERKYREEPQRQKDKTKFETDEGIRRDKASALAKGEQERLTQQQKVPEAPKLSEIGSIRKEYDSRAQTFRTVRDSKRQIDTLAAQPQNASNDLALLYSYIKLLDPDSVVREGEVTLSRSGSVPDSILSDFKRLTTTEGAILGSEARSNIVENSGTVFSSKMGAQQDLQQRYTEIAERAGLNPQDVVQDLLAEQDAAAQSGGVAPPAGIDPSKAAEIRRRFRAGEISKDQAKAMLRGQ